MTIQEFHRIMIFAASRMLYPPNFKDEFIINGWFNDLKIIDPRVLAHAMDQMVKTWDRFPSISEILRFCGKEHLTPEKESEKIADKLLQAAGHVSKQTLEALGPLAFAVSQEIGGFWDLAQMNLHDGGTYNTQRRRLSALALQHIRDRDENRLLEAAPTDIKKLNSNGNDGIGENIDARARRSQDDFKKTPISNELKALIHGLKNKLAG